MAHRVCVEASSRRLGGMRLSRRVARLDCRRGCRESDVRSLPSAPGRHLGDSGLRRGPETSETAILPQAGQGQGPSGAEQEQEQELEEIAQALAVTYIACKGGSLFALEAFIECVLEAFTDGHSMNEIKAQVSLLGVRVGPQSLMPIDVDVMVSWAALVMNTLQEVGLQAPAGGGLSESDDATYNGIRGFVQNMISKAAEGLTLQKVLLDQSMVPEEERSPSVRIMQQNTRIVFLALQSAQKARTDQLVADFTETTPSERDGLPESAGPGFTSSESTRRVAVRLLLAFTGLLIGSPFSLLCFAREAHMSYRKGWSVQELLDELQDEEYEQTGGIVPFCSGSGETSTGDLAQKINGLLLARFLSLSYITWALAGVQFPASRAKESWAWSDALGVTSTATEANSWAAMVRSTMKLEAARMSEEVSGLLAGGSEDAAKPSVAERKEELEKASVVYIEDPGLAQTSPTISLIRRQTAVVKAALTLVEGEWWTIREYLPDEEDVCSVPPPTSSS